MNSPENCPDCTYDGDVVATQCARCAALVDIMIAHMTSSPGCLPPGAVPHPHVEQAASVLSGSPMVRGTKVPVRRIWAWHRKGVSVETLVKRYPTLGPAKVLDALAFAYDNQALIEADVERERDLIDAECAKQPPLPHAGRNRVSGD